ncbi:hypothetical protein MSG28_005625 [Choristoneura fumiferana]|uniref:Uncharacterized protein n=1 Tax=Choristoneura fumiferana TaxID=7141 RepID=A0ACC0L022_CHOFU|nr:hypothetical protein MSG28_005625 [Choristoneura fumiferana]
MCGITFEIYHELCGEGKHREETCTTCEAIQWCVRSSQYALGRVGTMVQPSCSEKRPVLSSGTYIGWDDLSNFNQKAAFPPEMCEEYVFHQPIETLNLHITSLVETAERSEARPRSIALKALWLSCVRAVTPAACKEISYNLAGRWPAMRPSFVSTRALRHARGPRPATPPAAAAPAATQQGDQTSVPPASLLVLYPTSRRRCIAFAKINEIVIVSRSSQDHNKEVNKIFAQLRRAQRPKVGLGLQHQITLRFTILSQLLQAFHPETQKVVITKQRIATTILLANPAVKQQCLHCCLAAWRRLAGIVFITNDVSNYTSHLPPELCGERKHREETCTNLRSDSMVRAKFPIRTGPAWELWPKPSCSERRPVPSSGTYIGWDDLSNFNQKAAFPPEMCDEYVFHQPIETLNLHITFLLEIAERSEARLRSIALQALRLACVRAVTPAACKEISYNLAGRWPAMRPSFVSTRALRHARDPPPATPPAAAAPAATQQGDQTSVPPASLLVLYPTARRRHYTSLGRNLGCRPRIPTRPATAVYIYLAGTKPLGHHGFLLIRLGPQA